jgi:hypothetical protein
MFAALKSASRKRSYSFLFTTDGGYMPENNDQEKTKTSLDLKSYIAPVVAFASLVALGFFVNFLAKNFSVTSETWQRLIYLLEGIEAIAFAAAGYLFGSEVHRKEAADAKKGEQEAQRKEEASNQLSTQSQVKLADTLAKAQALKGSILAKQGGQQTRLQGFSKLSGSQTSELSKTDLQELADLANQLFPQSPQGDK